MEKQWRIQDYALLKRRGCCNPIFLYNFSKTMNFYRPQLSCDKVMFLHLSVSHSVHGGRGVCPTPSLDLADPPSGCRPPCPPGCISPWVGRNPPVGQTHPHADTPLDADPLDWADPPQYSPQAGGTHPTGMHTCKRIIWSMGMSPLDPSLRSEQCRIENFPEGVANSWSGSANLLFCNFFAKKYMIMKEFRSASLDPPMMKTMNDKKSLQAM